MRSTNSPGASPAAGTRWWAVPGAAAAAGVGLIAAAYIVGVVLPLGRLMDARALRWVERAGVGVQSPVHAVLAYLVPAVVVIATLLIVVGQLRRGDRKQAVQVLALVLGSEALAQVMKSSLPRPGGGTNTLPSGHVTMIAAFVVVLLAAGGWRRMPVALGALLVAGGALGTMIIGWHRVTDSVAACGVVAVCWGAIELLGRGRRRPQSQYPAGRRDLAAARAPVDRPTVPATRPALMRDPVRAATPRPLPPPPGNRRSLPDPDVHPSDLQRVRHPRSSPVVLRGAPPRLRRR